MFGFFKRKPIAEAVRTEPRMSFFSTDGWGESEQQAVRLERSFQKSVSEHVSAGVSGMDGMENGMSLSRGQNDAGVPLAQLDWFSSQGFIGYQMAAIILQHWLVNKACTMPAKDAIRNGYEVSVDDKAGVPAEALESLRALDAAFNLPAKMLDFVRMGKAFGIRIAMFQVESTDAQYYEKPYNPDGVTPGSYKGISMVDPYWCTPELDQRSATDPTYPHFYEPTWWLIGTRRIHRSHLVIFKGDEVPDTLKPSYMYGGVGVCQKIYERAYAAERTANEGPMLAMTKRLSIYYTDIAKASANQQKFEEGLRRRGRLYAMGFDAYRIMAELRAGRDALEVAAQDAGRFFTDEPVALGAEVTSKLARNELPCGQCTDTGRARLVRRERDPFPGCKACARRAECLALSPEATLLWQWQRTGVLDRELVQPELVRELEHLVALGPAEVDPHDHAGRGQVVRHGRDLEPLGDEGAVEGGEGGEGEAGRHAAGRAGIASAHPRRALPARSSPVHRDARLGVRRPRRRRPKGEN